MVKREDIERGAELLGIPLERHVEHCLAAMQAHSAELGYKKAGQMRDPTTRFAMAAMAGLILFVFALPVSCCGFVLLNEHRLGDVESGGPAAILSATGLSALLAALCVFLVWRKTGRR